MRFVAMIPARSGSKGLPDKNIKELCGRPLLGYSIQAAMDCPEIEAVFVNSDSQAYLDIAVEQGARPFLRSKELAADDTPLNTVLVDFIDTLRGRGENFDAVVILYPVYPLRNGNDLTAMLDAFIQAGGERPLVGMKEPDTHPYLCYQIDGQFSPRAVMDYDPDYHYLRQRYPLYYEISHWACVLPTVALPDLNARLINDQAYGYIIPKDIPVVDIDTPMDFCFAEFLIQSGRYQIGG